MEGVEKIPVFTSTTPLRYIYRGVVEVWDVAKIRCGGFRVWKSEGEGGVVSWLS